MNLWAILYRIGLLAIAGLLLLGAILLFAPKAREYETLQRKLESARAEVAAENTRVNDLRNKLQRFESDPEFVVQMGHEQGLVRPGEVLFRVPPEENGRAP